MFKSVSTVVLSVALLACGVPKPRQTVPQAAARANPPSSPAAGNYRIDSSASELRVLVYRAGPMARFGHNHVVVSRGLSGRINLRSTMPVSTFSVLLPVASFVVDDAQARMQEGPDFLAEVADDAKSGTLRNMLSAALLDAAEFPAIAIDSVAVRDEQGRLSATLDIKVAGHESRIEVPFTLNSDAHGLSAIGSLELRQSAIGLTPFSLMLGALQVQDTMRLKFKIVAVPG